METNWWQLGDHVELDFNGASPVHSYNASTHVFESSASISDKLTGSLLFYSDGDTVWGNTNNVLTNGTNLTSANNGYGFAKSTTQGSLFLQKPNDPNIYYLFSLGNKTGNKVKLEYAVIDQNTMSVVTKNNTIYSDTLSEKMTIAKHCNGKDYWLIVVNMEDLESVSPFKSKTEFLSFLITENGIQTSPIKSTLNLPTPFAVIGQMKLNNQGNTIATADGLGLNLFSFDKQTGRVDFVNRLPLDLQNGYGLEFSPNDRLVYINEKQYDLQTGVLTPLLDYPCPSQLQRASDGKIYKMHIPQAEVFISNPLENGFFMTGNINNSVRITQIANPNVSGISCGFDTTFIYDNEPNYNGFSLGLPNFASFYFNHPLGEFTYSNGCVNTPITFSLVTSNPNIDSVKWFFSDNQSIVSGNPAVYTFSQSGTWEVASIIFVNGVADTTFQCVSICGIESLNLPETLTYCQGEPLSLNALNVCSSSYSWNTGETSASIDITQTGTYYVVSNSSCGLISDTTEIIEGMCLPEIEIPNVFTPNNDLINDYFSVNVLNASNIEYTIFNRWGNVIKSEGIDLTNYSSNPWINLQLWNGESHSEGVYFYRIILESQSGQSTIKSGFFQLIN
ncbi:MAG: gliding motility-associated C-terminal domain-containing protein [Bacteroidetes bacterium]|nr:gliding motility-associated C-terminal domain-containing protein [Bacteroidota bacterium]